MSPRPRRSAALASTLVATAALAAAALPAAAQPARPGTLQAAIGDPDRLTLSGDVRARYEGVSDSFRARGSGSDQLFSLRTHLRADLELSSTATATVEVVDARGWGADSGSVLSSSEINTLDVLQAYVKLDTPDLFAEGAEASTRVGRFKLDFGSRRLVGYGGYPNVSPTFTGAVMDWRNGPHQVSAFYTLPVVRLPGDQVSLRDNRHEWDEQSSDVRFWGAFYGRTGLPQGAALELFLFGLEEEDGRQQTRDRDFITVGGRLHRAPRAGAWDFELEGGLQTGTTRASAAVTDVRDLDVSAHFLHAEVGYRFEGPWSPRVALEYDFGSGDADPTDDEFNRFDSLFGPRGPDFGPTGLFGPVSRSNISSPGVRVEVTPSPRWDAFVFWRALWVDETADTFANTGVRDATGASGSFAGHQVELKTRHWLQPRVWRLEFTGAALFRGELLKDAPNASLGGDSLYGAIDLTRTF
jgi:hypothetical protein